MKHVRFQPLDHRLTVFLTLRESNHAEAYLMAFPGDHLTPPEDVEPVSFDDAELLAFLLHHVHALKLDNESLRFRVAMAARVLTGLSEV